jgi:hypothetical protein
MKGMDKRVAMALMGLFVIVAAAFGYSLTKGYDDKTEAPKTVLAEKQEAKLQNACASTATYARLKEVLFEEAVRIRNADPANLDTLAASAVVRMENPTVKSRDEDLNVTVCTGRFVLELPPGAEGGFSGERRLFADIEYAAQAAADGSGLVYQMNGAEPIIYKLAAFDLKGQRVPSQVPAKEVEFAEASPPAEEVPEAAPPPELKRAAPPLPRPAARPGVERRPEPRPTTPPGFEPRPGVDARNDAPAPPRETARSAQNANPSFNCRSARSQSELMVCSSPRLARRDRQMSSMFYSALADADSRRKRELRRTRDRFLAYRERCGSEACVAEAYEGRMREIQDIMNAE